VSSARSGSSMTITGLNYGALARAFDSFKSKAPRDVLLLSPSAGDMAFLRDQFPRARVFVAARRTWDLNEMFHRVQKSTSLTIGLMRELRLREAGHSRTTP
jgi:hypothetical protein